MSHQGRSGCRLMIMIVLVGASGCSAVRNEHQAMNQAIRAHHAWRSFDTGVFISSHSADYALGWKSGYRSVMAGGDGRPPVIPPKRYWDPQFFRQSDPQGQSEWHQGFLCGAANALKKPAQHFVRPLRTQCHIPQPQAIPHPSEPYVYEPPSSVPYEAAAPLPENTANQQLTIEPLATKPLATEPLTTRPLIDHPRTGHSIQQDTQPMAEELEFNSRPPTTIPLVPKLSPLPPLIVSPAYKLPSEIGDAQ